MNLLNAPYPTPVPEEGGQAEEQEHIIDVPHCGRAIKTIIQGGHFSHKTKLIERPTPSSPSEGEESTPTSDSSSDFCKAWIKSIGKEQTLKFAGSGGAFVVSALCDRVKECGLVEEAKTLKQWLGGRKFVDGLGDDVRGRAVLVQSIEAL